MDRLEELTSRLAAIVESSNDAILSKDLSGIVLTWNPAAERLYGYKTEEIVGRSVSELIPPERRNELREILAKVGRGERVESFETERIAKDGRRIEVSVTVSPIKDGSGRILGASTIARDISEQRRLQAELSEQKAVLSAIFKASPDIIATVTSRLETTYVNPAAQEILGYEFSELLGEDSLHWVHPDDVQIALGLLQSAFGEEGAARGTLRVRTADDRWIWLDLRIRRMEAPPDTAVVLAHDVTEQTRLQDEVTEAKEEAERANRAKSVFLSSMSHELRTPLSSVIGFAQLLELEDLTEEQRESTSFILKGGRRLQELINEVLDISRIESGTLAVSLEPVEVGDAIAESVALIYPIAVERGVSIEVRPEIGKCYVLADSQRLAQALLNLLSNATKYNVPGGTISVASTTTGDRVRIAVTDSGPGIPQDKLPLLFMPFERLGAEQTTTEGTGLGLSLVKRLVETMGGEVSVETEVGRGSTFWMELPIADAPPEDHHDAGMPSRDGSRVPAGLKILYVEDNLANLTLIEKLLSRRVAVELIPAMTGMLGVDLARQHQPDLILLDLHLPDIPGSDVMIRLSRDPRTKDIPVVVLSADASPRTAERLLSAGARDYILKPVDVPEFLTMLDRILG